MTVKPVLFASEALLHQSVSAFFARMGIPHVNQLAVGDGFADVCLELPDGRPWALLELKNGLDPAQLQLADAADFFEQSLKYRLASGLPVFVGPFFHQSMGVVSGFMSGGHKPLTISALSAIGGRGDIGLFFLHAIRGYERREDCWYGFQMLLRQTRVASWCQSAPDDTIWPREPLRLVDFLGAGSRKDRR
jgi:hypothetical protein